LVWNFFSHWHIPMLDMPCFIKIKKNNPVENRSNFLRSERLQFFAYFISCTDAQRSSQIHLRCLWDEITESWRIMVSFMLSLSCKDTIVIIKRKLSRTNTIHGHSYVKISGRKYPLIIPSVTPLLQSSSKSLFNTIHSAKQ